MSRKLLIAIGIVLAVTLAFSGMATAGDASTSGGECVGVDLPGVSGGTDADTAGSSGDVGTSCCTTECGIF